MTQWLTDATLVFDLPAAAFTPPPKVVSSIVRLVPRVMAPDEPSFAAMEKIVAACFAQRRKMLRAGLRSFIRDPLPLLEAAGIDPTARAEELDVAAFRRLAVIWESQSH
jgi:16S rRNA (adenine1518-N6/adenine1519-N6)-dimethyltransferase